MKKIKKYLKIYKRLMIQNIKTKMEFKTDFIISALGILMTNIIGFFTIYIIFLNTSQIGGLNYNQAIFLYAYFLIVISPQQIFFDNIWNIWVHFIEGSFIKYCLRPMDSMFYYISESIDLKGFTQLITGIVLLIYSGEKINAFVHIQNVLLLILLIICSSVIYTSLMIIAASTGFWITDPFEVISLVNKTKDFGKYPISLYSKAIQIVVTFILPFGFIGYYPILMFLSMRYKLLSLCTIFIAIFFFFLARIIWKAGEKRYEPTGN